MISIALRKSLQGPAGPLMLDLQAEIAPGSFVTLFGRSGAGKTTVLRMLAGLADPDEGNITVDGVTWFDSARRVRLPPQKRSIGFMFQDQALFPNLSVRANIAYATADAGWINELLDVAGLRDLQHRLPATLSGGQRQRVALARAIARKPTLLLLDEPLSALDTEARTQLQDDLARMHRRFGFTVLLVSHDVGEVFKLSQRVLLLDEGRLVRSGSPSEVFLRHHLSGRLNLHGQVLAIRHEEVVYIISLLVGNDIIDVLASADEVADMHVGDLVAIAAKTVSPLIRKA